MSAYITSAVNQTIPQNVAVPIFFLITGICLENSFSAILELVSRLLKYYNQATVTSKKRESPTMFALLLTLNFSLLVYAPILCFSWFSVPQSSCVGTMFSENFFWHIFFIVFDVFILWKSWIVTDKSHSYLGIAILVLFYRIAVGILDLVWTGGRWDEENGCEYIENPLSTTLYTAGDIACDVVATLGALTMFLRPETKLLKFKSLWLRILQENVFRSIFTLIVDSAVLYGSYLPGLDQNILYMAFLVQQYIYLRLANMEIRYKDIRTSGNFGAFNQFQKKESIA